MKIGLMLRHLEQPGGIGTYTRNLLTHLLERDDQNDYVLMYRNAELIGTYSAHPRVVEVVLPVASNLLWDQWAVPKVIKQHKIELVFNPKLSVPIMSSCKKLFCMHGGEWFVFPQNYSLAYRAYHKFFGSLYTNAAMTQPSSIDTSDITLTLAPSQILFPSLTPSCSCSPCADIGISIRSML